MAADDLLEKCLIDCEAESRLADMCSRRMVEKSVIKSNKNLALLSRVYKIRAKKAEERLCQIEKLIKVDQMKLLNGENSGLIDDAAYSGCCSYFNYKWKKYILRRNIKQCTKSYSKSMKMANLLSKKKDISSIARDVLLKETAWSGDSDSEY